jgi:dynein light chain roadblock-type
LSPLTLLNLQSEVEETIKRVQSHKGVQGIIVLNTDGIPIRTTLDNTTTVQYAGLITQMCTKARSAIKELDASVFLLGFRSDA